MVVHTAHGIRISIHAPREGSDLFVGPARVVHGQFLSTLPARGATTSSSIWTFPSTFLSTLPARGATALSDHHVKGLRNFYPRSPRGERLAVPYAWDALFLFLSTLPARGATSLLELDGSFASFLSTLPARGATSGPFGSPTSRSHFYPRSPRGERLLPCFANERIRHISIHAPREGSDNRPRPVSGNSLYFYPRSPRGERQRQPCQHHRQRDFYPRSPRGERLAALARSILSCNISIHAPREGSDGRKRRVLYAVCISIHAPREGSDIAGITRYVDPKDFYPRSPRGERPPCRDSM